MFHFYQRRFKNSRARFGEIRVEVFGLQAHLALSMSSSQEDNLPVVTVTQHKNSSFLSGREGLKIEQLGKTVTVINPLICFPKGQRSKVTLESSWLK